MSRIQCVSKPLCASLSQVHFGRWFGHWLLGKNCSLLVQTCADKIPKILCLGTRGAFGAPFLLLCRYPCSTGRLTGCSCCKSYSNEVVQYSIIWLNFDDL